MSSAAATQGHCAKPIKEDSLLRAVHAAIGQTGSTGLTPPARKAPRGSPLRGSLHVLVAEDNAVNQKVATALLTKWGHTLKLANNGREAVDMIDKEPFDLILMDVSCQTKFPRR